MSCADRDELLNVVLPFAKRLLAKYGEFYPFGATVGTDGKKGLAQGYAGDEKPPDKEVLNLTLGGMQYQARAGKIRAAALCVNVRVSLPRMGETNAIQVTLEDADEEAANCFLPYQIHEPGQVTCGELVAGRAKSMIFEAKPGS